MERVADVAEVVTVGFVVPKQEISWTRFGTRRGKRVRLEMHTSTIQPLLQVLVRSEDADNMTWAFEDAAKLCKKHGGFDLAKAVIQVHKDDFFTVSRVRSLPEHGACRKQLSCREFGF